MKSLNPYLNFGGRTREALEFYATALGGETTALQTFAQAPMDMPAEQAEKVMHAEFRAEGVYFMASDGMGNEELSTGNAVSLSINLDDEDEQTRIFDALAVDGVVLMPLDQTFWGARFGVVQDRFGLRWMLNCQKDGSFTAS